MMEGIPHGGCWRPECAICNPDQALDAEGYPKDYPASWRVQAQSAQSVLNNFKQTMAEGHPWMAGFLFVNNPGLDQHILAALEEFVLLRQVEENAKPARRVSLSDDPNWRPSSVVPVVPGSKGWVEPTDGKDVG